MSERAAANTTVVVAAWDLYAGDRLAEALASIRAQEFPAAMVLVDNASKRPIPQVAGASMIRSSERLTLGQARNLGLDQVTTRYVVFWDADDLMLPGTLRFLQEAIEAKPEFSAFGMGIIEDPSGRRHRWPRRWMSRLLGKPRMFALLDSIWSMYPTTGATIMRTELVRAAGGYGTAESGEDWCLGVSLAFRGRLGWNERPGRIYRVYDESVWPRHMSVRHQLRHARAVRERLRNDAGVPGWSRTMLPLIQAGQTAAIIAHATLASLRRLGSPRSRSGR